MMKLAIFQATSINNKLWGYGNQYGLAKLIEGYARIEGAITKEIPSDIVSPIIGAISTQYHGKCMEWTSEEERIIVAEKVISGVTGFGCGQLISEYLVLFGDGPTTEEDLSEEEIRGNFGSISGLSMPLLELLEKNGDYIQAATENNDIFYEQGVSPEVLEAQYSGEWILKDLVKNPHLAIMDSSYRHSEWEKRNLSTILRALIQGASDGDYICFGCITSVQSIIDEEELELYRDAQEEFGGMEEEY